MLKIKDDVDLKELEKFGFKYRKDYYIKYVKDLKVMTVRVEPKINGEENKYFYISVNNEGYFTMYDLDTIIYEFEQYKNDLENDIVEINKLFNDLIQAGLVEKIEE